jgi:hypothetical protein
MNQASIATNSAGSNMNSALSVNAEQYNAKPSTATPTIMKGKVSVGAEAYNEKK